MARTQDINCLTSNTNIKAEDEYDGKSRKGGKGKSSQAVDQAEKKPSLFSQVLKRRKSRQSNYAPGVIDFNYAGDSAQYSHLIQKRGDV